MSKKLGSIILSLILCVSVLSGCQTSMKFDSEEEMRSYVDGVWKSENFTCAVSNGKFQYYSEATLDLVWTDFSFKPEEDLNKYTAQSFYEEIYLTYAVVKASSYDIVYDYENSKIISSTSSFLEFSDDGTAIQSEEVFTKISDSITYVEDEVKLYFEENIDGLKFEKKYTGLPSAKEVQYNKYGHFGDNFIIEGTAVLDDYYNWGYKNYEYGYFCIRISPTGGTYSDGWYVYANRKTFSDLYSSLQNGSKNVTLVAQMVYVDTSIDNMATLVDYM